MATEQIFKAVYFSDYKEVSPRTGGFALAFGNKHKDLYKNVANLGSSELRDMLGTHSYAELEQRAEQEGLPINTYCLWYLRRNLETQYFEIARTSIEEKPVVQFENQVFEGDCLEVMKGIPAKSIDMVLCDLPYGTTQNHWDSVIPLDQLWNHYERIIKDNGVISLTAQGLFTAQLMLSNQKLFKYKLAWIKS